MLNVVVVPGLAGFHRRTPLPSSLGTQSSWNYVRGFYRLDQKLTADDRPGLQFTGHGRPRFWICTRVQRADCPLLSGAFNYGRLDRFDARWIMQSMLGSAAAVRAMMQIDV